LQANAESQKNIKRYQQQLKDVQTALEEEQRARDDARELLGISERRANALQNELEESRTLLEQADRGRRQAEQELSDAHEHLNELSAQNTSISAAKRKLESELQTLHVSHSCHFPRFRCSKFMNLSYYSKLPLCYQYSLLLSSLLLLLSFKISLSFSYEYPFELS
jgi:DNA repair exonuclease SbcCD ATPase subunit